MKETIKFLGVVMTLLLFIGCGKGKKNNNASLNELTARLEKLKSERKKTDDEIVKLQDQISNLDPTAFGKNAKLVRLALIDTTVFQHFIDLRGSIDAEDISYISPRMGPSQVKAIYVKEGQVVKKGQLLLKLDDAIIRQQVAAANQQLQGIRTQLAFSRTIYDRQKNLWEQGIGTEVQLINAKTNAESLENQLKAAGEQVKVAEEQLRASNVYSDVSGIADIVNIKVGEIFSGMTQTGPQIKIVSLHNPKVVISIPENYIGRLKVGTFINIYIPDAGKTYKSQISLISQSIDPIQRGFIAEAKIQNDGTLKPNQSVVVKIMDYSSKNALVIPVNAIQSDEKGKYIFVATEEGKGMIAKRLSVMIGEVYADSAEVKTGLKAGLKLVTDGYQNLYEGQQLTAQ